MNKIILLNSFIFFTLLLSNCAQKEVLSCPNGQILIDTKCVQHGVPLKTIKDNKIWVKEISTP